MLLLFTLVEFLAVAAVVVAAANKLDDSSSNVVESLSSPPILPIKHERQRDAMLQALNSVGVDDKNLAFTSSEEQRSQYYIHEGFKPALHRAMRMANFDPETVWDFIVDVDSNNSDSSDDVEVEQWELAYSYFIEETLADMISDVEKSLQELTATNNNNNEGAGDDEGQQTAPKNNSEASNSGQDQVKEEDFVASELYYSIFDKIHNDNHCEAYNNLTLDDPRGMWMNITKLYWKFFDIDIEDETVTTLNSRSSLHDYKTEGNVYFDYIFNDEKRNVQAPYRPKQSTTLRGVFAARDFEQDELVYSYMANSLFFHELSTFERFIRFVSTSLSDYDACLLAGWSFAQKLTRPGRYYICSALDEGVYLNQGSKYKANVYMDDTRDLRYYAKGKIVKGDEIICLD